MNATRALGAVFVVLVIFELLVLELLQVAAAGPNLAAEGQSFAIVALGMAWIFGLWAALVAFMVFMIAWVAEGMSAEGREADARAAALDAPHGPVSVLSTSEQLEQMAS
jgi:hypothetical protein